VPGGGAFQKMLRVNALPRPMIDIIFFPNYIANSGNLQLHFISFHNLCRFLCSQRPKWHRLCGAARQAPSGFGSRMAGSPKKQISALGERF
jgi:hypothetical protein